LRATTIRVTGVLTLKPQIFVSIFQGGPISASSDPDCFHSFPVTGLDTDWLCVVPGWSLPGGVTAAGALLPGIQTLAMNPMY